MGEKMKKRSNSVVGKQLTKSKNKKKQDNIKSNKKYTEIPIKRSYSVTNKSLMDLKKNAHKPVNTNIDDFIKLVEGYQTISGIDSDYEITENEIFDRILSMKPDAINEGNAQLLLDSFNKMMCKYYKIRKFESKDSSNVNKSGFFRAMQAQVGHKYGGSKDVELDESNKVNIDIDFDVKFSKLLDKQYYSSVLEPLNKYEGKVRKNMKNLWQACAEVIIAKDKKNPNIGNVGVPQFQAGYSPAGAVPPSPPVTPATNGGVPMPPPPPPPPPPPMLGTIGAGPTTKGYYELPDNLSRWQRIAFKEMPNHGGKKSPTEFSVDELISFAKNREQIQKEKLKEEIERKRNNVKLEMMKLPKYKDKEITNDEVDAFITEKEEKAKKEAENRGNTMAALKAAIEEKNKIAEMAVPFVKRLNEMIGDKSTIPVLKDKKNMVTAEILELTGSDIRDILKEKMKKKESVEPKDEVKIFSDEELEDMLLYRVIFNKIYEDSSVNSRKGIKENKSHLDNLPKEIKEWIKQKRSEGKNNITSDAVMEFVKNFVSKLKSNTNLNDLLSEQIKLRFQQLRLHEDEDKDDEEDDD